MSIKDRISAFERSSQRATPVTSAPSQTIPVATLADAGGTKQASLPARLPPIQARAQAGSSAAHWGSLSSDLPEGSSTALLKPPTSISRTLAAGSLTNNPSGWAENELEGLDAARHLSSPSPTRDRASKLLPDASNSPSASIQRSGSPMTTPSTSPTLGTSSSSVGSVNFQPNAASRPPPLPQRQTTQPPTNDSVAPASRPLPPLVAKPAHLARGRPPPAAVLTVHTSAPPSKPGDLISFSPIGPASSSPVAVENAESPRQTSRPGAPALPSRQSTVSSVASLPPPLPSRKPTLPAAATPPAAIRRRQPPPVPESANLSHTQPRAAGPSPSPLKAENVAASARYSALFTQLLALRRVAKMKRIMAGNDGGWPGAEERDGWLQSVVVRAVWNRSKLSPKNLRDIWCVLTASSFHRMKLTRLIPIPTGTLLRPTTRARSIGRASSAAWR